MRFQVRKKKFKALADQFKSLGRSYYASDKKDGLIVILMDKVEAGSERRIIYPEVKGGILSVQANECGPFRSGNRPAQVVTNERGERLSPVVNFRAKADAKPDSYHVKPGGHVAIFEGASLVVVKAVNDTNKLSITKFSPMTEGDTAWLQATLLHMGDRNAPLPTEFAHFAEAVSAVNRRVADVASQELHFAVGSKS